MVVIADHKMARRASEPEVWFVQQGVRHWVPDSPTVDNLGGWGMVQVVADRIENPIGDNWPSIVDGHKLYPDGNLLVAPPDPAIYLMESHKRRWVPDPETFTALGLDWAAVRHLTPQAMEEIALGEPIPHRSQQVDVVKMESSEVFFGAGHWMRTRGTLTRSTGRCSFQTRTRTQTMFGGFHGAVSVVCCDVNDAPVVGGLSPYKRYAVDGTWIGRSDRTDAWDFSMTPDQADLVYQVHMFHTWDPNSFQTILGEWVATGRSLADLAESVGKIAKVVKEIVGSPTPKIPAG